MKNLPVPVFLRPVDEKEASMKVFPPVCLVTRIFVVLFYLYLILDCCDCVFSCGVLLV